MIGNESILYNDQGYESKQKMRKEVWKGWIDPPTPYDSRLFCAVKEEG